MQYYNTPIEGAKSPAMMLMNRCLRTTVPCTDKVLINKSDVENRKLLISRQKSAEDYYNRKVNTKKSKQNFKPGDAVVYRDSLAEKIWKQAKILRASKNPRSYDIQNEQGRTLNRNTRMLLPDKTGRVFVRKDTSDIRTEPASRCQNPIPAPSKKTAPPKVQPDIVRRSERVKFKVDRFQSPAF